MGQDCLKGWVNLVLETWSWLEILLAPEVASQMAFSRPSFSHL